MAWSAATVSICWKDAITPSTTCPSAWPWRAGGAITISCDDEDVLDRLADLTHGKGPQECTDAVGREAHRTPPHRARGRQKAVDLASARALSRTQAAPAADYSGRSGWPRPPADRRGAALDDFEPPRDLRMPQAMRPWATGQGGASSG